MTVMIKPPHWATHLLKHIPTGLLFYADKGDLAGFPAISFQQAVDDYELYQQLAGRPFPGLVQDWEVIKPIANPTATEYLMRSKNNARRFRELAQLGVFNADSLKRPCQNYPLCACAGCIPLTPPLHKDADSNKIYQMIIEQNPERRERQRKPVTSLDWELLQAINHLQNAISVTDSRRGHLLQAAVQVVKGVRESD